MSQSCKCLISAGEANVSVSSQSREVSISVSSQSQAFTPRAHPCSDWVNWFRVWVHCYSEW